MTKEDKIKEFAENNSLISGISRAERFDNIVDILKAVPTPFVTDDIEKRVSPALSYENAKSIVCLGMNYNKKYIGKTDERIRGKISVTAIGEDYHTELKRKLNELKENVSISGMTFVDTGNLADREVARRCGLGVYGKNRSVISEKFGSMFFIGYILTDEILTPTKIYSHNPCGDCRRCINACPTGALGENSFDYTKCISYLTQFKGEIEQNLKKAMGRQIYGCDNCQTACPYNIGKETLFNADYDKFYPPIDDILNMDSSEFKAYYKKTAAGWRGKKTLQRNAQIALDNITRND